LVVHDQSLLRYPRHARKTDQAELNHGLRGYELTAALLVDGRTGDPIAPLELQPRARKALYSTRPQAPSLQSCWLDERLTTMRDAAALLPCPLVHVLDRGADSVGHYRQWAADGRLFLVRADAAPTVSWRGCRWALGDVARRLAARQDFRPARTVVFRGREATQEVA